MGATKQTLLGGCLLVCSPSHSYPKIDDGPDGLPSIQMISPGTQYADGAYNEGEMAFLTVTGGNNSVVVHLWDKDGNHQCVAMPPKKLDNDSICQLSLAPDVWHSIQAGENSVATLAVYGNGHGRITDMAKFFRTPESFLAFRRSLSQAINPNLPPGF
ncbi:MAG TPA: hypothetical protein VMX18_04625 [Candidatus Bipolaricaulota bacterium]|nr:hypothetical protein [Candidatus Bipolaricaulota bacterium]